MNYIILAPHSLGDPSTPRPKMQGGEYRLHVIDETIDGRICLCYILESAFHGENPPSRYLMYVEEVRRLATERRIPVIIVTVHPHLQIPPIKVEYLHSTQSENIFRYLFLFRWNELARIEKIIVPYTESGVQESIDVIQANASPELHDDVRSLIRTYFDHVEPDAPVWISKLPLRSDKKNSRKRPDEESTGGPPKRQRVGEQKRERFDLSSRCQNCGLCKFHAKVRR